MRHVPAELRAGVPITIELSRADVPEGWTARLALAGPMALSIDVAADAEGATLTASAQLTASWSPGRYQYQLRAIEPDDGAVIELEAGKVSVLADVSLLADGHDARSHAERVLDAIEATIEGRATSDQESYAIAGRSLSRTPLGELVRLRSQYRAEVAREKAAAKGRTSLGRQVLVRMP